MSKETQRSPDRLDWDNLAADALELARLMPPGPERNEALKLASLLRCTADARGLIFAKRAGRESDHHSVFCRLERTGATTFVEKKIIT
jgi:hypothetical protein